MKKSILRLARTNFGEFCLNSLNLVHAKLSSKVYHLLPIFSTMQFHNLWISHFYTVFFQRSRGCLGCFKPQLSQRSSLCTSGNVGINSSPKIFVFVNSIFSIYVHSVIYNKNPTKTHQKQLWQCLVYSLTYPKPSFTFWENYK